MPTAIIELTRTTTGICSFIEHRPALIIEWSRPSARTRRQYPLMQPSRSPRGIRTLRSPYTEDVMALDVAAVQQALRDEGLDGWLLYDFQGSNPIATRLAGLAAGKKMTTRRWYYLIPAHGEPRGLVHAIERHNLDGLPGDKRAYAGRDRLEAGLRDLLKGVKRVAMEYSPHNNIPYV